MVLKNKSAKKKNKKNKILYLCFMKYIKNIIALIFVGVLAIAVGYNILTGTFKSVGSFWMTITILISGFAVFAAVFFLIEKIKKSNDDSV